MGLFNIGTVVLTFAYLLNSIGFSLQANFIEPEPYPEPRPPSYVIDNNTVRLTGESVGGLAVVVDDYFLGTLENNQFRPVDPDNLNSIIRIRNGHGIFTEVTSEYKNYLKRIFFARMYIENRRRGVARGGHAGASSSHQGGGRN